MQQVLKVVAGACVLVGVATAVGLASNALRQDSLPLIRKPLGETRAVVGKEQLMTNAPIGVQSCKKSAPKTAIPRVAQSKLPTVISKTKTQQQPEQVKPKPVMVPTVIASQRTAQKVGLRKPEAKKPPPASKKIQALFTNLKDGKACFDNKSAIFLDARLTEDYEAEHITGALWLCYESVEEDYDKVLGQIPKDRLLITYCSDQQCASAIKLADALVARGHTRVVIMLEGLPGWIDAGYPTSSGKEAGG